MKFDRACNNHPEPKKVVSTLEGFEDSGMRRNGATTRLVDKAIQIIFSGNVCLCEDHCDEGNFRRANLDLYRRVLNRMHSEHRGVYERQIEYDRSSLTIWLVERKFNEKKGIQGDR